MKSFAFALNETVIITVSDERGQVIGRAEYVHAEPSYLVRYKDADGKAAEVWWTESSLSAE